MQNEDMDKKMGKSENEKNWKYGLRHTSILQEYGNQLDLMDDELALLYRFYVLNAPYPNQSKMCLTFKDYGWEGNINNNDLGRLLERAISDNKGPFFIPSVDNGVKFNQLFQQANLDDGRINDLDRERCAIKLNTSKQNKYVKLFRHIRNCLAHGRFKLVATDLNPNGVFIMEDRDRYNITARIVLRKQTLLEWIHIVRRDR